MRSVFILLALVISLAPAAFAAGQAFAVPERAVRQSAKVVTLTPEMMLEECRGDDMYQPYFYDEEYLSRLRQLDRQIESGTLAPAEQTRQTEVRRQLRECREADLIKDAAFKARRSCKALRRWYAEAAARVNGAIMVGWITPEFAQQWVERFREPVENCLSRMRCRVDNRKDMEELRDVYEQIVSRMRDDTLALFHTDHMRICGVTLRNLRQWCGAPGPDGSIDLCYNAANIRRALDALNLSDIRDEMARENQSPIPVGAPQ